MMLAIVPDVRLQVHECLRYLASRCDGADNDGFKRVDELFGRQLAEKDKLTLAQVVVGAKMIRKYRRQLEAARLSVPTQPEVEAYMTAQLTPTAPRQAVSRQGAVPSKSGSRVYIIDGRLVVEFPYDKAKYAAIAPLKEKVPGWSFNFFERKEWSFPAEAANVVLDALKPFRDFKYSEDVVALVERAKAKEELARQQVELEEVYARLERQVAVNVVQPFLDGDPVANGQVLFEHQREAVRLLIEGKRVILAHDLGLGKTRSALIAAKGYELRVIVICPAGLKINWQREAEAVQVPIEIYSWAKLPRLTEDDDYILIADEAHYAQTLSTRRTQGFLSLAKYARAVFALTGTPMKNGRPINLYPLLVACKHPLAQNKRAYERRYCNAHMRHVGYGRQVYDVTGASHLDELHVMTRDTILYKKKEECLKDLPPKLRVMRQAEVSKEAKLAYQAMIDQLRQKHQQRMEEKRELRGSTQLKELGFEEGGLDEEMDDEQAEALVELGILRQAGSMIKIQSAIDIAQEVLEQGGSIVLFTAYRESAKKIAEALDAELISGEVIDKSRQEIIDRFQIKEKRALVCLIGTGGVGHTFTAAQTVVLVDRPWTPGDAEQCEDRLHRIGQQGSVTAIWLQFGAIDEKIDALLQRKQERIDLVAQGKRKTMRGIESIRSMAKEILESVHNVTANAQPIDQALLSDQEEKWSFGNIVEERFAALPGPAQESTHLQINAQLVMPTLHELESVTPSPAQGSGNREQQTAAKKDGRLKGEVPRVRINIILDEQIAALLRSMKASNQTSSKESGYSGFLERLVRETDEFEAFMKEHIAPSPVQDLIVSVERKAEPAAAKKDGRLKGEAPRVRVNIMLDNQVVSFLRSMKASNQTSSKEGGYSGFLEGLVRKSDEFKGYLINRQS